MRVSARPRGLGLLTAAYVLLSALVDGTKATVDTEAGESALRGLRDYCYFMEYGRSDNVFSKTGRGRAIAPSCIEIADQIVLRQCIAIHA